MASNSQASLIQDGYVLPTGNNSITSGWVDKRSSTNVSLSFTLTGSGSVDGYAHVEASDAPENYYVTWGSGPLVLPGSVDPVDANTIPGSTSLHLGSTGTTHWDIQTAARWVRVVYVANSSSANLQVYCWASVPFESA
jgi:hypothetical protein